MADSYLLSRKNYDRLRRVVRDYEGAPRSYPRMRRRTQVFPPAAGAVVYQAAEQLRLRPGTVANATADYGEPVVIAAPLGTVAAGELRHLRHVDVFDIREILRNQGAINPDNGRINEVSFDEVRNDPNILNAIEEQTGERNGLVALRARFCRGYVGTGMIVVGNETECWYGGSEVFEAELQAAVTAGDELTLAEIEWNRDAITRGIAMESVRVFDRVAVRDPLERAAIYIPSGTVVQVAFNQQVLFDDDKSADWTGDPRHWYTDATYGLLPVFNLIYTQLPIVGKADGAITSGNSGTVSVWNGTAAASLADTGDNVTAYSRYGDATSGVFQSLVPAKWGWEIIQQPCA